MARTVLNFLPNLDFNAQENIATGTVDAIAAKGSPEASEHATLASQAAANSASHGSRVAAEEIRLNALGIIAELDKPEGPPRDPGVVAFHRTYQDLGCKTYEGFPPQPSHIRNRPVVVLTRDSEGTLHESMGLVNPHGPDNTAFFTLKEGGEQFNSNNVVGLVELPIYPSAQNIAQLRHDLQEQQQLNAEKQEFSTRHEAQGHPTTETMAAQRMDGREIAFLYKNPDGTRREFEGTVCGMGADRSAEFYLLGRPDVLLNSNNIQKIAFMDGQTQS
jgi:hypothetical protein